MNVLGVSVVVECEECENGTVYDPTGFGWGKLNKLDNDAFDAELRARGYDEAGRSIETGEMWPPEEGPCPDCDGAGRRTVVMPLEEFRALMEGAAA